MRTTLSIDDDLATAIERIRERGNKSLRETINELLRAGLESTENAPRSKAYRGPVFDCGLRPGIDPNRMNQLADELEAEAFES